jgi:thioredoxin 1
MTEITEMHKVTRDSFDQDVLGSELPVVLDFWGPKCVPCVRLEPSVIDLSRRLEGAINFFKVEAPANRMLCVRLRVMTLPTFVAYKNGEEVARLTGDSVSIEDIEQLARSLI